MWCVCVLSLFFFSSRRRHTRCALVTGVQTCALPISWHAEPPVAGTMGDNPMLQFVDSPGFWVVTSHELVSEVDRDQERFSSELGGTFIPSLAEESLALFRQMMLNMDHPRHTRLRRILQPVFTPRSIEIGRAHV